MSEITPIGIKRFEAIHYYVTDLERSRRFYTGMLDFIEIASSSGRLEEQGQQRSAVFEAGNFRVICSQPLSDSCRAARWLAKHPAGVGTVVIEVEDLERAFALLDGRGGTPIEEIAWVEEGDGRYGTFNITTPFGGSTFRFVERQNYDAPMPGLTRYASPRGGVNCFGFDAIDHVTSNFETIAPATLWLEHVLGLKQCWEIQFHSNDVAKDSQSGSGLRSKVFHDPISGVKFANNEPMRPHFKASQINLFYEQMRGDGIQHAAITVGNIVEAVRGLRARGVSFYPTPGTYYDALPARLKRCGVGEIEEDIDTLRELEILVDGSEPGKYLLQVFVQDAAHTHGDLEAGPFFFEIIQRKGDDGFGGGNFRALFDSIERQQQEQDQPEGSAKA